MSWRRGGSGDAISSKNQNPREGIETKIASRTHRYNVTLASKNQNPREGIETHNLFIFNVHALISLQKTKIPARGLKPSSRVVGQSRSSTKYLQKTKIPARGLKREKPANPNGWAYNTLQKTKIPARGLKRSIVAII